MCTPPAIHFDPRAGHYVVSDAGAPDRTTRDLVEAVAWADPEGTGIVYADAITRRHLDAFTGAPIDRQPPATLGAFAPPPRRKPPCVS